MKLPLASTPILRRAALRHLWRHPWQTGLTVLGVALAVAVVVGIDLANASAERAFLRSVEDVAGRATHEIVGGPGGLDESIYATLRLSGLSFARDSAPIVEGRGIVQMPRDDERGVGLLGIDPLAEAPFRDLTRSLLADGPSEGSVGVDLGTFLTTPGAVALGRELADALGVAEGDTIAFEAQAEGQVEEQANDSTRTRISELRVVAVLEPTSERARRTARDLLIVDLATAQEAVGRIGTLDRVDLLLPEASSADAEARLEALRAILPPGAIVRSKAARAGALAEMTRAFRLNLEALSLLALLVGTFLVYNTLTVSVVQRRGLIGRLRALGVRRDEIFTLVLAEAAVIGVLGTALGLAIGVGLAQGLVRLITQTINDLYFSLDVRGASLAWSSLAKGAALGLGGPILASIAPAREATNAPPRLTLQRSAVESRAHRAVPRAALAGVVLLAVAAGLLAWPTRDLLPAFAGVFAVVVGFACLVPGAILLSSRALVTPAARVFGGLGRLATRGVEGTLSRTGVAAAALVIAVATTLGIAVMVSSFRATLVDWLEVTLQADVYVTSARQGARGSAPALDPAWIEALSTAPGVELVTTYRRIEVPSHVAGRDAPVSTQLHALSMARRVFEVFQLRDRTSETARDEVFRRWAAGEGVLVSEPFSYRHRLDPGDAVELVTEVGPREVEVLGVFYDYASDRGIVMMHRALYDRLFDDPAVHSLGLFLAAGSDADAVVERLRERVPADAVTVAANRELKRTSMAIFDRTFRITGVLRLLAVGVAFLGILSALMALQLERGRELGVLRANGLVPAQVWGLVTAQTGLLGLLSGLLALPLGTLMAALLIHVINKRSFGWTLRMEIPPSALVQTVALALVAALLAGLWPARRMAGSSPALALREE